MDDGVKLNVADRPSSTDDRRQLITLSVQSTFVHVLRVVFIKFRGIQSKCRNVSRVACLLIGLLSEPMLY